MVQAGTFAFTFVRQLISVLLSYNVFLSKWNEKTKHPPKRDSFTLTLYPGKHVQVQGRRRKERERERRGYFRWMAKREYELAWAWMKTAATHKKKGVEGAGLGNGMFSWATPNPTVQQSSLIGIAVLSGEKRHTRQQNIKRWMVVSAVKKKRERNMTKKPLHLWVEIDGARKLVHRPPQIHLWIMQKWSK